MAKPDLGIPERPAPRKRAACGVRVLVLLLAFAIVLCLAGSAVVWNLSQRSRLSAPEIILQEPANGARVWTNRSNAVFAIARDPKRIARVELWVDGQFVQGRASSVPDGTNPFPAAFEWRPSPGAHSISILAYSTDNRAGQSNVINVNAEQFIAQSESRTPTPQPTAPTPSAPGVQPTPTGQPTQPAQSAQPSPTAQSAQPEPTIPPGQVGPQGGPVQQDQSPLPREPVVFGAPLLMTESRFGPQVHPENLTAELMGACRVRLRWTDASTDEAGYHIYRRAAANAIPELISILAPNTTEFTSDLPRPGSYQFYVQRLITGIGEWGRSNTVTVNAAVCPAEGVRQNIELVIGADSLSTLGSYSDVYCYAQIGLGPYDRVPEGDDTIHPVGGVYNIRDHFAGDNAHTIMWASEAALPFNGECWGVRGVTVDFLGRWSKQHPPEEWDGRELVVNASGLSGQPGGRLGGFKLVYRIYRRDLLPGGQNWLFTDPDIPIPVSLSGLLNASPEEIERCLSNVFAGAIEIGQIDRDLCTRNWALMWGWAGNAYVDDSPGAANLLDGFRVYLRRWTPGQPGSEREYITAEARPGRVRGAITPYRVCGQTSEYRVTAFFGNHESRKSTESIVVPGNPCKTYVRVTFGALENILRGSFSGYGTIYVNDQVRGWGCLTPGFGEGTVCDGPVHLGSGRTTSWDQIMHPPSDSQFIVPLDENDTLTFGFWIINDEDFGGGIWFAQRTVALRDNMNWATFHSGNMPVSDVSFTTYVSVDGLVPPDPTAGAGRGGVRTDLRVESLFAQAEENLHVVIRNDGPQFLLGELVQIKYEDTSYEFSLDIPVGGSATVELPVPPASNSVRVRVIPLSFIDPDLGNNEAERNFPER